MDELNELLSAAQAGDLTATGELLERFQSMATGYAYSLLGDEHLAEDAVQAAYFEACIQLPKVYNAAAFPAWLRRLVFKQCDRIRRKRKVRTVPFDETAISDGGIDAATALEEHEKTLSVRRALAALPDTERQVALLHYFQQRSRGEIAAFLELSLDQVAYRLSSARRLFKEQLTAMDKNGPSESRRSPQKDAATRTTIGKNAFKQIGDGDANTQLAYFVGLLKEHISLGITAKDRCATDLLQHSVEVAQLAGPIAERLGLDPIKAQRAGLLHDMGKVLDEQRLHPESGAEKAAELGEDPEVVAAIAGHHDRGERLDVGCFLIDINPLCFALVVADSIMADRIEENTTEADLERLTEQIVELDGGHLRVHGYLYRDDLRILVQGPTENKRETALAITDSVRKELDFSRRVRVTLAPS